MRIFIGYLSLLLFVAQVVWTDPPTPPTPPVPPVVIPDVPDPPVPPPTPVEQGQRTIAVIYETEDSTDDFARTILQLRTGQHEEYLRSKGHSLYVLDDDTTDAEGDLSQFIANLVHLNPQLPCLYVMDSRDGRLLESKTVTFDVTAEEIMAFIRANGG